MKDERMDIDKIFEQIMEQESTLVFDDFTNETALLLGNKLAEEVKHSSRPVAIRIYIGDIIVFQYSMQGKEEEHYNWIRRKRNLMKKIGHCSMYGRLQWQFKNNYLDLFEDRDTYGFGCGAFPIIIKTKGMIGTIALSGLPDPQDHVIITNVLKDFLQVSCKEVEITEEDLKIKKE